MVEERLPKGDENPMKNYTLDILAELTQNGQRIDTVLLERSVLLTPNQEIY